jgi:hypothetical protein
LEGPAVVSGSAEAGVPIQFHGKSTGLVTSVDVDASGSFRAALAEGSYVVSQGASTSELAALPGGTYHMDLRRGHVLSFTVASEPLADGEMVIRVTAHGAGRHEFSIRTDNLSGPGTVRAVDLSGSGSTAVEWREKVMDHDSPWVAVVVPDGVLDAHREITGVSTH